MGGFLRQIGKLLMILVFLFYNFALSISLFHLSSNSFLFSFIIFYTFLSCWLKVSYNYVRQIGNIFNSPYFSQLRQIGKLFIFTPYLFYFPFHSPLPYSIYIVFDVINSYILLITLTTIFLHLLFLSFIVWRFVHYFSLTK